MTRTRPSDLDRRIAALRGEYEAALKRLVEIPTVSMDPGRRSEVLRGASVAAELIRAAGGKAQILSTRGFPVVLGHFAAGRAAPTVTIYNHLDVQPAQEPQWRHDPFAFRAVGGRYEGRGTTDDKGPAVAALFACRLARQGGLAREFGLPVNLNLVWEFEEEIGSPHFAEFVRERKRDIACDVVLVSDTIWISRSRPAIPYGLRGMITMTFTLETGTKDVHSGLTGGAARNPLAELAAVISRIVDARTGRVKIPGFYRRVSRLGRAELRQFLSSGFRTDGFKRAHGLRSLRAEDPASVLRRIWAEPTFEVHGLVGGYTGPGVKTVVPQRAEAKVSCRLVPKQSPETIFQLVRDFVYRLNPDVRVALTGSLKPYLGDPRNPYFREAAEAMRVAFGRAPAFIREGGSIGAVVALEEALKVPIVLMGLSLPEHGYHAPNECFDWRQAHGGMRAFVEFFQRVSAR